MKLDEAFKQEYSHQIFHGVRDHIFRYKLHDINGVDHAMNQLTEGERYVILVNGFIWEVTNGGLSQFLSNSTGDDAEQTLEILEKIEAHEAAAALKDIKATIFGGEPIPKDRKKRCDIFLAWEEEDETRAQVFYEKHDLGFCESVEDAIAGYILTHKEMFLHQEDAEKKVVTIIEEICPNPEGPPSLLYRLIFFAKSMFGIYSRESNLYKTLWVMDGELQEEFEYAAKGRKLVGPVPEKEAAEHLRNYIKSFQEEGCLVGWEFSSAARRLREQDKSRIEAE